MEGEVKEKIFMALLKSVSDMIEHKLNPLEIE